MAHVRKEGPSCPVLPSRRSYLRKSRLLRGQSLVMDREDLKQTLSRKVVTWWSV